MKKRNAASATPVALGGKIAAKLAKKKAHPIPGGGNPTNPAYPGAQAPGYGKPVRSAFRAPQEDHPYPHPGNLKHGTSGSARAMDLAGGFDDHDTGSSGTSIFDPVLTEVLVRWFSPPGGTVLDPFAGGSVRGVVASKLGRGYVGVELRAEQVEANRAQLNLCGDPAPVWHVGDSRDISTICAGVEADFVLSCPPYADLEVYSEDPRDISAMVYPEFLAAYRMIIAETCALLKPDRFAAFVVGEVRGPDGCYYGLVPDTIRAFTDAGLRYYDEMILVTAVGSLPIRAGGQFKVSRKIGKTHQNALVFAKGNPRKAADACGTVEAGEIPGVAE